MKTFMKNFNLTVSIIWFIVTIIFAIQFTINGTLFLMLMSLMSFGISVIYFLSWLTDENTKTKNNDKTQKGD